MRKIRGDKISIIFQEPMTTLNPLHTIEKQVGEIIKLHQGLAATKHAGASLRCSARSAYVTRKSGWVPIRTNYPAVSASA